MAQIGGLANSQSNQQRLDEQAQSSPNNLSVSGRKQVPISWSWKPEGTFNGETGPLAALQGREKYISESLSYPRDLNSDGKKHSVQFVARPVKANGNPIDATKKVLTDIAVGTAEVAEEVATDVVQATSDVVAGKKSASQAIGDLYYKSADQVSVKLQEAYKINIKAPYVAKTSPSATTINLYMPDGIEFGQHANYNQIGVLDAAASVPFLGKIPSAILSTLRNDQFRLTLNSMGYVFNPREQVLFEGIDFRTFSMSFTFTPFSADESAQVKAIIKAFRKNAAPTIQRDAIRGFFYVPPAVFDIIFLNDGKPNNNINKLKECVLTDVTVNYAPNGTWSTYGDGMPVQTTLNLSFKEIELVDSDDIDKRGY